MRNDVHSVVLGVFALLLVASPLRAQVGDNNNAATWYQKAIDAYESLNLDYENDLRPVLEEFLNNPQIGPSPEAKRTLARIQPTLDLVSRGTAQEYADFNLDYQQGFELLLPHLGAMRNLTKLMNADAMARMHAGDTDGAAARISATYDMSGHLSSDRTLISSLVGNAIFNVGEQTIQFGLDREVFNAADAAKMLQSVESLNANDPFGMLESAAMEAELAANWFNSKFEEGEEAGRVGDIMVAMLAGDNADDEQRTYWSELNREGFIEQVGLYESFMDEMVAAFHINDADAAKAEFARLEGELETGKFGELSKLTAPALSKCHERLLESREIVAARKAMLREMAEGQTLPSEHANAVTYYLRAIELLEQQDDESLARLRDAADGRKVYDTESLAQTLADLQPAIDLVREGSFMRRCDFIQYRPRHPVMVAPPYAAGLHDLMRLLQLDVVNAAMDSEAAALLDRLGIVYRFAGHIASDDQLMSSIIAHDGLVRTMPILEAALATQMIDDDGRNRLFTAMQRITRSDPFGYINAVSATRKRVGSIASMSWYVMQENGTYQLRPGLSIEPITAWSAPRLAMISAVMEHAWANDQMAPPTSPAFNVRELRYVTDPDDLARLDDLIHNESLDAARRETLLIMALITGGDLDEVTAQPVHDVFDLSRRLPRARADLRRASGLLRSAAGSDDADQ